jgi:transcriptional regulator with XRE-family HTH domain
MAIHIGKRIKQIFEKKGMSVSEFSRRLNSSRENVYDIFKRQSIDTSLLEKICKVLDYDFFQHFTSLQQLNEKLNEEIERLKSDNALLREMNDFLKEKAKKK